MRLFLIVFLFVLLSTSVFSQGNGNGYVDDFSLFESYTVSPVIYDPLEGYNRLMTDFNNFSYDVVIRPVAVGYRFVLPEPVRVGIKQFFNNIFFPIRFVNNVMQFKLDGAGVETVRFVTNSTLGIAGIFDPARDWFEWYERNEDFGQTLAVWGVGPGPYFVIPFLGPSTFRDVFGRSVDYFADPMSYTTSLVSGTSIYTQYGIQLGNKLNSISLNLDTIDSIRKNSLDFYTFVRDAYYQNRESSIRQ